MHTTGQHIDADIVLQKLGILGRYQIWVLNISCLPWLFTAAQMMSITFVNAVPKYACVKSQQEALEFKGGKVNPMLSQCDYYDNTTSLSYKCLENGTFFTFDGVRSTAATEFLLVCGYRFLAELTGSVFMVGILVGSLVLPGMADRLGRRWIMMVSTWCTGAFGLLVALMPNYTSFALMRFLTGVAYAGCTFAGWVLACEILAPRLRAYATIGMGIWWTAGYCLLAPVAYALPNWRALTIAISVPVAISFLYIWFLPESLHWLVAMKKWDKAESWVVHAAKINKVEISFEDCLQQHVAEESIDPTIKKNRRTVFSIFTSKVVILHTLLMAYLWLCNTFVYYGLSLFSTSLIGEKYMNFALSGFVEFPAYFVTPVLLNWHFLGRRWTIAGFHILAGISLLLLMVIPEKTAHGTDLSALIIIFWLLGKFAISCSFGAIFVYGAELFPTTVRSAGLGLCGVSSRIGGILAPYIGLAATVSELLPPALFGFSSLIAAFVTLLLPETVGRVLPDDIDEVEFGPWLKKCCSSKPPTRSLSFHSNKVPDLVISAVEKKDSLREVEKLLS